MSTISKRAKRGTSRASRAARPPRPIPQLFVSPFGMASDVMGSILLWMANEPCQADLPATRHVSCVELECHPEAACAPCKARMALQAAVAAMDELHDSRAQLKRWNRNQLRGVVRRPVRISNDSNHEAPDERGGRRG